MRRPLPTVLLAVAVTGLARPATAERLVASLSNRHVMITSNYTGVELVLFGSVEREATNTVRAKKSAASSCASCSAS